MNAIERSIMGEVSLIDTIQLRESNIDASKMELLQMWVDQGVDLQKLQKSEGCSQNYLTELTGISKGSIFNYIQLSKDERILKLLDTGHHGDHLVDDLNQKKLVKLTKLDDEAFDTYLETGTFPSVSVESDESEVIDAVTDDEATVDDQIEEKEIQVRQLKDEIFELKKQLPNYNISATQKAVLQFTKGGVFLAEFTSVSIAEISTGIDKITIDKVCRGTGSLDGGFIWRFTDQKDMDAYTG